MRFSGATSFVVGLCLLAAVSGCVDSPVRQLLYRKEWQEDERYGPTFPTRLKELQKLRKRADQMSPDEQVRLVPQLLQSLAGDPNPLYRAEVVRTLGAMSIQAAAEGLRRAVQDQDPKVRMAACKAWGRRGGEEALHVLANVLGSDTDVDVRLAAARELARFRDPEAIRALGLALDDRDPAIQHRAVESLKQATGRDLGDSVPAWRQYVRDGTVPERHERSIAERLRSWF